MRTKYELVAHELSIYLDAFGGIDFEHFLTIYRASSDGQSFVLDDSVAFMEPDVDWDEIGQYRDLYGMTAGAKLARNLANELDYEPGMFLIPQILVYDGEGK